MRWSPIVVLVVGLLDHSRACAQDHIRVTHPFAGIRHEHVLTTVASRPQSVHVVIVDLQAPQLSFLLTPPNGAAPQMTNEQTTQAFMVEQGAQVAINTHFFTLDALPTADLLGFAASDGEVFAPWASGALSAGISIGPDNVATLVVPGASGGVSLDPVVCPHNSFGVSLSNGASPRIVTAGVRSTNQSSFDLTPNPRTVAALMANHRLLLATIDGRQPGIAEGMTLPEAADFLIQRYAVIDAINLDGGGSTTLTMDAGGPRVMNTPVGVGSGQAAMNTERSNGANLAIFATRQYGLEPDRDLIACEGFAYPNRSWGTDGTMRPAGGSVNSLNGGEGWASQWNDVGSRWAGIANYGVGGNGVSGIAGDLRSTPLSYNDVNGNALPRSGGQYRCSFGTVSTSTRQIDLSLIPESRLNQGRLGKDGTTMWLSFLAQSFASTGTSGSTQRFAYVQLGDTVRFGKLENSPTGNWGVQDAGLGGATNFSGASSGTPSMILARVEFRNGDEQLTMWVNPRSLTNSNDLGTPSIVMPLRDFGFADVSITGRYSTDFDEIRLGWTFESVVGP